MSEETHRRICASMLALALAGTVVGVADIVAHLRGHPLPDGAALLALWLGGFLPQVVFALAQSYPGGRDVVRLWRSRADDGWTLALVCAVDACIAAALVPVFATGSAWTTARVLAFPFMATAVLFLFMRTRQLRRAVGRAP